MRQDFKERLESCSAFEEGPPAGGPCMTDGHYICQECKHINWRKIGDSERAEKEIGEDAELEREARRHTREVERELNRERASPSPATCA